MTSTKMEWSKLLSSKRLGRANDQNGNPDLRTGYTRDWDRVIFSSAFRRMQDKTQVFPLAKNDYIRTRLTHSLEVASVGRSLGMIVASDVVFKKEPSLEGKLSEHDFGAVVAAACLAHDIGNPPFGHAGESAIQEWFSRNSWALDGISEEKKQDFLKFEGNAQGFRLLTRLQHAPQPGGMQLTYAVLGAFMKYPRYSKVPKEFSKGISGKKFGFMHSEGDFFQDIARELGLNEKKQSESESLRKAWYRHPLAFLVEAADDICYHIMDIEDAFKVGVIEFDELLQLHEPWLKSGHRDYLASFKDKQKQSEYLRAITIGKLIFECVDVFRKNYDEIMSSDFDSEITDLIPKKEELSQFKSLAVKKVYRSRKVLEIEACGFEVIGGLLNNFVSAVQAHCSGDYSKIGKVQTRTLINLLPEPVSESTSKYEQLLIVTDFISGMTDSYAIELYQRINGISLP